MLLVSVFKNNNNIKILHEPNQNFCQPQVRELWLKFIIVVIIGILKGREMRGVRKEVEIA